MTQSLRHIVGHRVSVIIWLVLHKCQANARTSRSLLGAKHAYRWLLQCERPQH